MARIERLREEWWEQIEEIQADAEASMRDLSPLHQRVMKGEWPCFTLAAQGQPLIFGEFLNPLTGLDREDFETDEDFEESKTETLANAARGFLFSKCFSEWCPRGEMGDTHVTRVSLGIDRETFEMARASGWKLTPELRIKLMEQAQEFLPR